MTSLMKERMKMLRQAKPNIYNGTDEQIINYLLFMACEDIKLVHPIQFYDENDHEGYMTIEYCEKAYDLGYDTVINDGKVIAFKRAV